MRTSEQSTEWPTPKATDGERGGRGDLLAKARGYSMAHNGTLPDVSNQLPLFAEAFPVNRFRTLVNESDLPTTATSGRNLLESFAKFDRDGSWLKTSQGYCQLNLDGSLERFSETWPRSGMTRNGIAFQRPTSALPIYDNESGLSPIPTPTAQDHFSARVTANRRKVWTSHPGTTLLDYARLWPTPTSRDYKDGSAKACANVPANGLLGRVVHQWSTPKSSASGPDYARRNREGSGGDDLVTQIGGALNPMWVEWLMGYPVGWTDCVDWGMPSSRKSRNGSGTASRTPNADGPKGGGV